ncbi:MAG: hypothetical protein F4X64_17220 [Chloroflexi bacterium]|nr:hypothetical protein [Chloroflexota bacterium]
MQWAIYRFVYEPAKRRVHQVGGCSYSDSPTNMQRQGFRQVGHEPLASVDEAMEVARRSIDPKVQPCGFCAAEWDLQRIAQRRLDQQEWDRLMGRD